MLRKKYLSKQKSAFTKDNIIYKPRRKWTESIHRYLKFLIDNGLGCVPQVLGFDSAENEMITFIHGECIHPNPWNDEAIINVGKMLKELHSLSKSFIWSDKDIWQPWFLHEMGSTNKIISHCDFAPWNTITSGSNIVGLIDWEFAGPVDPLIELARVCWLFIQLYDTDVGQKIGLPSLEKRSNQLSLLIDSYELEKTKRSDLLANIIDVAIYESAEQAIELNVGENTVGNMWGISWRARSAKWIIQNRKILENAIR